MKKLLLLSCAALLSSSVLAGTRFGIAGGVYIPRQKKVRDALGSQWLNIGLTPVQFKIGEGISYDGDIQVLSRSKNGNRILIITPSYGITARLSKTEGEDRKNLVPYAALRIGPSYYDYAIGSGASRISKRRLGFNANAELGVLINDSIRASLRYDNHSRFDGFDFNGLSIQVAISLGRF